jgi:hypothetical protein
VEQKLIILVTGESCAGKDYCADVWVSVLRVFSLGRIANANGPCRKALVAVRGGYGCRPEPPALGPCLQGATPASVDDLLLGLGAFCRLALPASLRPRGPAATGSYSAPGTRLPTPGHRVPPPTRHLPVAGQAGPVYISTINPLHR